jgi:hypothetical protein
MPDSAKRNFATCCNVAVVHLRVRSPKSPPRAGRERLPTDLRVVRPSAGHWPTETGERTPGQEVTQSCPAAVRFVALGYGLGVVGAGEERAVFDNERSDVLNEPTAAGVVRSVRRCHTNHQRTEGNDK